MTASIIAWDQIMQTTPEKGAAGSGFAQPKIASTTLPALEEKNSQATATHSITEISNEHSASHQVLPLPANRIYPHVFDENIQAGQALIYFRSAISDAQEALESFGVPDVQEVSTRLTHIAVAMGKAHLLTEFNESIGGVVSYIRRATLLCSGNEITRSALNSLLQVLQTMAANPMLDLDEATDLVERLTHDGWRGAHGLANELVMALTDDSNVTTDELQTLLFETTETPVEWE